MKFNINNYKENYVMHCKTEEEDKSFRRYLDSVGRTWCNGKSYILYTKYEELKESTCYEFNEGKYDCLDYFKTNDYKILEWSDFMNKEFTKSDLKNGDFIKYENGEVGIVFNDLEAIVFENGYNLLNSINEDLRCPCGDRDWDIIAVRRPKQPSDCRFDAFDSELGELVYERKELEYAMNKLAKDLDSFVLEFKEKVKRLCDEFNKN